MNSNGNIDKMGEVQKALHLSTEERHDFASYFTGAVSRSVKAKDWQSALDTAALCIKGNRERQAATTAAMEGEPDHRPSVLETIEREREAEYARKLERERLATGHA